MEVVLQHVQSRKTEGCLVTKQRHLWVKDPRFVIRTLDVYELHPNWDYTVRVKLPSDCFVGSIDRWTFKLVKIHEGPCHWKGVERCHNIKTSWSITRRHCLLQALDTETELQLRGTLEDEVTLNIWMGSTMDCIVCDAFYLQVAYVGYSSDYQTRVPLLMCREVS